MNAMMGTTGFFAPGSALAAASDAAQRADFHWHCGFEDLGTDPDPERCVALAASAPNDLLRGFLIALALRSAPFCS